MPSPKNSGEESPDISPKSRFKREYVADVSNDMPRDYAMFVAEVLAEVLELTEILNLDTGSDTPGDKNDGHGSDAGEDDASERSPRKGHEDHAEAGNGGVADSKSKVTAEENKKQKPPGIRQFMGSRASSMSTPANVVEYACECGH